MPHLPLRSIMTVVALTLAGCGTPASVPQPNPVLPPPTASAAGPASPTASVPPPEPSDAAMVAGREAAESLGYTCEHVDAAMSFIVGQAGCTRDGAELIIAEYTSSQDRARHLRSWAPRPVRPVGQLWLIAADHPEDLPVVADAIAGS